MKRLFAHLNPFLCHGPDSSVQDIDSAGICPLLVRLTSYEHEHHGSNPSKHWHGSFFRHASWDELRAGQRCHMGSTSGTTHHADIVAVQQDLRHLVGRAGVVAWLWSIQCSPAFVVCVVMSYYSVTSSRTMSDQSSVKEPNKESVTSLLTHKVIETE